MRNSNVENLTASGALDSNNNSDLSIVDGNVEAVGSETLDVNSIGGIITITAVVEGGNNQAVAGTVDVPEGGLTPSGPPTDAAVGDVNLDGNITIEDANDIARFLVGKSVDPFNENLANTTRAQLQERTNVQIGDAQAIADVVSGPESRATYEIQNATLGSSLPISGDFTVNNTGYLGTVGAVYYRVAKTGDFDYLVYETQIETVDLGRGEGIFASSNETVSYDISPNLDDGSYAHRFFIEAHNANTDSVTGSLTTG